MTLRALSLAVVLGASQILPGSALARLLLPSAPQPSFDCAKSTDRIAQMICSDAELARWDAHMGQAYKQKFSVLGAKERGAFLEDQRRLIASRNAQCSQADSAVARACILQITKARLATLEQKDRQLVQSVPPSVSRDSEPDLPPGSIDPHEVLAGCSAAR